MGAVAVGAVGSVSVDEAMAASNQHHRPRLDPTPRERVVPPPCLKQPFRKCDASKLTVTNGFFDAADEMPLIGWDDNSHQALDFEGLELGVPILAPADGIAWCSYQFLTLRIENDVVYGGGAGLFVEIQHEHVDVPGFGKLTTQLIHLGSVAEDIPYLPAVQTDEFDWHPSGVMKTQDELRRLGIPVRAGDVIGTFGATGIGREHFNPANHTVIIPEDTTLWDPQQLHMAANCGRDPGRSFARKNRLCLSGLYGQERQDYPEFSLHNVRPGKIRVGPRPLWLTNRRGEALFADE